MAREAKKRVGRPPRNPPTRGQRVSLGLKVTAEVKRHLDSAFRTSGRTQSQEAEHLIEKALADDQMLNGLNTLTSIRSFRKEHYAEGVWAGARARATLTSIGSFRKEHYAEGVWAIWEKALANDPTLAALSTLTSIAPLRKSRRTQLQREHYAARA